jgi:hypothetical protein
LLRPRRRQCAHLGSDGRLVERTQNPRERLRFGRQERAASHGRGERVIFRARADVTIWSMGRFRKDIEDSGAAD